jgi:hypothetical protein
VAAHIATQAAVVVMGPDLARTAAYAVAVARATATSGRRVAIGDLVGDLDAVYALAGGEDAPGITDCFRDGLPLTEVARPVADNPSLFVLPSGARVRSDPALADAERWSRLVRGFAEAGGLLLLVAPEASPLLPVLGQAGAVLLYAGPAGEARGGIPLAATIGAPLAPVPARRAPNTPPPWLVWAAAAGAIAVGGGGAVGVTLARNRPDGTVRIAPVRLATDDAPRAGATAWTSDTVAIIEQLDAADSARAAPYAVELVATTSATDANSRLAGAARDVVLPAATVSVVAVRRAAPGATQGATRWHKVMAGAWRTATEADSALGTWRGEGVLARGSGAVVRAPYAVLLVDGASAEQARAVIDVWRAKGVAPYALLQDDGGRRVYAGAFETVAQGIPMAAMIRSAGGAPIVAYRTGRPD